MTAAPDCSFELAPWQRAVRMAGLAAAVAMVFTMLLPPAQEFRDPLEAYTASLWHEWQYDNLITPLILVLAFASLVCLNFGVRAWAGNLLRRASFWLLGLALISFVPAGAFTQSPLDDVENVLADPYVRLMLAILACGLFLLLVLVWPMASPGVRGPHRVLDWMLLVFLAIMALTFPLCLVLGAMQGSIPGSSWLGAFWYVLLIAGVFRGLQRERVVPDSGGGRTQIPKGIPRGWRFVLWQGGRWALGGSLAFILLMAYIVPILSAVGVQEPKPGWNPLWLQALGFAWASCLVLGQFAFLLAVNPLGTWPSRRSSDLACLLLGWTLWLPWFAFSCWLVYSLIAGLSQSPILIRHSIVLLTQVDSARVPYFVKQLLWSWTLLLLMIWYPLLTNYHFNPFWPLWVERWREAISRKPQEVGSKA